MNHDLRNTPRRKLPAPLLVLMFCLLPALAPTMARADINLVAPSRTIDPAVPFRLSLMVTGEAESRSYSLPEVLRVNLTPDLGAVARVELRRETPVPEQIDLRPADQTVIQQSHTERQSTFLVETTRPVLDPAWTVSDVGLEELVLAYMATPSTARPAAPALRSVS